jgi:hypothetical protein
VSPALNASPDFFISRKDAGKDTLSPKELLDFRTNWLEIERHKHPDVDTGVTRPAIKVIAGSVSVPAGLVVTQVPYVLPLYVGSDLPKPTLAAHVVTVHLMGIYHVTAEVHFDTLDPTMSALEVDLYQNGAFYTGEGVWQTDGTETNANAVVAVNLSTDMLLSAGDTVGVSVIQDNTNGTNVDMAASFLSLHFAAPGSP